ncbi:MAG: hypothetical protein L3K17_01545, partial [Thermoplasmata archaeon]|nr:hypothetical protein [Thermoplasmata archaeon]
VLSVILANFSVPVAGAVIGLGGAAFPIVAGFDGGAWQHWINLAGYGELGFSWDNGALAFVVSFVLFSVVLLLAAAVALRDALLAVLLVLLPVLTLGWPIPTFAPLARRAWLLFGELVFLPCVLVIPLELAVGSSSVLLLLGYLTVALSTPWLVSLTGAQLTSAGFPSGGSALTGGIQRGLSTASTSVGQMFRPMAQAGAASGRGSVLGAAGRIGQMAGRAGFPATAPLIGAELVGRGATHLVRHIGAKLPALGHRPDKFPPVKRSGGPGP